MRLRSFLFLTGLLAFIPAFGDARAQDAQSQAPAPVAGAAPADVASNPGATVETLSAQNIEAISVNFDQAFQTIENPFFADTLKLNYQINLLDKMVARQSELNKISESMGAVGVTFTQPAPPRGICLQLPVNAPCLKAYPDLYPDVVAARKAHHDELVRRTLPVTPAKTAEKPANETPEAKAKRERAEEMAREKAERAEAERREKAAHEERKSRYQWTDISCLGGVCKGVLVSSQQQGFRASVREGSVLNDGTVVRRIDRNRIRVSIGGDVVDVRPAPSDTQNPATSGSGGATTGSGIAGAGMTIPMDGKTSVVSGGGQGTGGATMTQAAKAAATAAQSSAPAEQTADGAAPAQGGGVPSGQTTAEPALGPSGLF